MADHQAWRKAFARQSSSDLKLYQLLCRSAGVPQCHRLHYLQMHLEKIAKAHLYQTAESDPSDVRIHNVIAKVLPRVVAAYARQVGHAEKLRPDNQEELRSLCREIDLLQPSIDADQRRPDNCEYPWREVRNGLPTVLIPAEEKFRVEDRLRQSMGKLLLKVASKLCEELGSA